MLTPEDKGKGETFETHRFRIDKSVMRVRYEDETGEGRDDGEVTIVIEPKTDIPDELAEILCGDDLDQDAIDRDLERMDREAKQ